MSDISSLKFIRQLFQISSQSASVLHILGISHQMVNRECSSLDCHLVSLFWWHSTIFSWNKEHQLSANDVLLQFWERLISYGFSSEWNPLLLPKPIQRWNDNTQKSAKKKLPAALYTMKVLSSQWPSSSYLEQHGKQCDWSQAGCRGSVAAITMSRFIIPPTTNSVRGFAARQVWRLIL